MNTKGMNRTIEEPESSVRFFEGEKRLVLTGLLGFLLAGVCAVWVALYGGPVSPDGNISKAFSFNAALGIFLLSTAAIAPFSAMRARGRAFFRWSYILLALYSYFAETVQNFRGVNPRFVKEGTLYDEIIGNIFALVALLLVLYYLFFAIQFFRKKAYLRRPALVVGIRYAMIAVMLSFMAGIWISVNNGRTVGIHGNIIVLHGLGFHALQALPLVAWLSDRTSFSKGARTKWIHLTGIAYVLGLIALGWQTYLGRGIFEWSTLSFLICACFLISLAAGAQVLRKPTDPNGVPRSL
ncbi:hypothetical protein DFP95_1342 [Cohnella lupini]|uniref:Uncharacterized protein n=2 Tax=Cohnella lupini TaxID=1294267 RepID=A0A3D9HT75_9BACL|nr:hypothetical protein DFP95_1342 [Cohnella lupini]